VTKDRDDADEDFQDRKMRKTVVQDDSDDDWD
jgi:hypothetical protein